MNQPVDLLGPRKGRKSRNVRDCGFLGSHTDPPAPAPPPNVLVPETEFSQQLHGAGPPAFSPFTEENRGSERVSELAKVTQLKGQIWGSQPGPGFQYPQMACLAREQHSMRTGYVSKTRKAPSSRFDLTGRQGAFRAVTPEKGSGSPAFS